MFAGKFGDLGTGRLGLGFRFIAGSVRLRAFGGAGSTGLSAGLANFSVSRCGRIGWCVSFVVVCCLVFGVFGPGPAFGMKRLNETGDVKRVAKVVKRFVEVGDRDRHFLNELSNSERGKVLKSVSSREGARLLGLVDDQKELERVWANFMSRSLRDGVWPHLDQRVREWVVGNGGALQGFATNTERQRLVKAKGRFIEGLPALFPASLNGQIVFGNVARFLGDGDVCRMALVCDHVWPQGRERISRAVKAGRVAKSWEVWANTLGENKANLFAQLPNDQAFEVWSVASRKSKNWLYKQLPFEQRERALLFEGGLYREILASEFGRNAKMAAVEGDNFEEILDVVWSQLNTMQRIEFLSNHPDLGVKHFFIRLFGGVFETSLGHQALENVRRPNKVDLAIVVWPKLGMQGRASWLKDIESQGSPKLFGFFHDLTTGQISGEHGMQAQFTALGAKQPSMVVGQVWDLLTSKDKQRATPPIKVGGGSAFQAALRLGRGGFWRVVTEGLGVDDRLALFRALPVGDRRYIPVAERERLVRFAYSWLGQQNLQPGRIMTVAGDGREGFGGDNGLAIGAQLHQPSGVFVSSDGHLFIADWENHRVRRVTPQGVITTVAGDGRGGFGGDNGLAIGTQLHQPSGVFVSSDGHLFIADWENHRVRRVTPQGVITTVAGNGARGFGGDNGLATGAQLYSPVGVFVTPDGSLFIADRGNHRVRCVTPQGIITTIAGNGIEGFGGDNGPATNAQLNRPFGVFVTPDGHLYIADSWSNRVRHVTPQGIITTIAGNGIEGFGGDNGPATNAQLYGPVGVFMTPDGHLYISDQGNNRVRRVTPQGIITTIVGNGEYGFGGDNRLATGAQLYYPSGVFVTPDSYLYIADQNNHRVRVVNLNQSEEEK